MIIAHQTLTAAGLTRDHFNRACVGHATSKNIGGVRGANSDGGTFTKGYDDIGWLAAFDFTAADEAASAEMFSGRRYLVRYAGAAAPTAV